MASRRIKPPPVPGTWTWLHLQIRDKVNMAGIYRAALEDAFGRMRAMGEQRIEARLEEWRTARRMALRIADGQVEVRKLPCRAKVPKPVPSMQDVEVRGLF